MTAPQQYALEITWNPGVDLPSLVGPFGNMPEVEEWARVNIPNGTWTVRTLAYPYRRDSGCADPTCRGARCGL